MIVEKSIEIWERVHANQEWENYILLVLDWKHMDT